VKGPDTELTSGAKTPSPTPNPRRCAPLPLMLRRGPKPPLQVANEASRPIKPSAEASTPRCATSNRPAHLPDPRERSCSLASSGQRGPTPASPSPRPRDLRPARERRPMAPPATPTSARHRVRRQRQPMPARQLDLPEGLDHAATTAPSPPTPPSSTTPTARNTTLRAPTPGPDPHNRQHPKSGVPFEARRRPARAPRRHRRRPARHQHGASWPHRPRHPRLASAYSRSARITGPQTRNRNRLSCGHLPEHNARMGTYDSMPCCLEPANRHDRGAR